MKRYGSSNNLADDFGYSYFSGTNRLQTIGEGLTTYGYTYDNNGNMTSDQLNRTGSIKYDHRNLMTEIRAIKTEANPDPFGVPFIDVLYLTNYRYDEAGNRISKVRYKYTGSTPDPIFEGDNIDWTLQSSEYYIRDVSGKEVALYSGSSLTQWNIWGLDNVGKINADTTRNYYLKDHLGSIRVVLNSTNGVVSAQDYDAWGYPLENRIYNANAMKYDFTGKERDNETSYDYFGARYYDSRIGRWSGVEPLLDKYISWSSYAYGVCNPINVIDINGLDNYVFDENGQFIDVEEEEGDRIVVRGSDGSESSYDFNDPDKDVKDMKSLLSKYGKNFKINIISSSQVQDWMEQSGAESILMKFPGIKEAIIGNKSFAGESFDFWEKYLIKIMTGNGLDEFEDVRNDAAGYFIFQGSSMAYNGMDAGNFLWGYAMNEALVPLQTALTGAQIHNALMYGSGRDQSYTSMWDSQLDQQAIGAGWNANK